MKKLSEVVHRSLKWVQPSAMKMNYELLAEDEAVATLRFRSSFGTFATGESGDGCWTFKRVGFWQTRVTIRPCDTDTEIASFRNNTWTGGGTLELAGGRTLRATTNFWQTQSEFQDESGGILIRFRSAGLIHLSAVVEMEPSARRLPELPWLVLFGWYLTVMMHMDSSGAGGAAAASG